MAPRARRGFGLRQAFGMMMAFVGVLWIVHAAQALLGASLVGYGVYPRTVEGLAGVLWAPLIHGSWAHLLGNTVPLVVLGTALLYGYPRAARLVVPAVYFGTGLGVWLLARPSFHVGASGLTYGALFFVFTIGVLRWEPRAIAIAMIVFFLYGGMVWGVFPGDPDVSFESHLAGALIGVALAFASRHRDPPAPRRRYSWEDEPDAPDEVTEVGAAAPWPPVAPTGRDCIERSHEHHEVGDMEQARDFRDESEALYGLLDDLPASGYARATDFKSWTVDDILAHLHFFNELADLSLVDPDRMRDRYGQMRAAREAGGTMVSVTRDMLGGLHGPRLREVWHDFIPGMTERFSAADPRARVEWVGPSMSVRSSITARLMETWSHAQAIYDRLGVERVNTDRIRNVAHLGVSTFGWTFANRGEPVPPVKPHVRLIGPSGDEWAWNEPSEEDHVQGRATEFCQVVTQTRNVADTALVVRGDAARRWMALAQCFAGPPNDPPAPGTRRRAEL